jgi:hypothetical protein
MALLHFRSQAKIIVVNSWSNCSRSDSFDTEYAHKSGKRKLLVAARLAQDSSFTTEIFKFNKFWIG